MALCTGCRSPLTENCFLKCNACRSKYCCLCLNIDSVRFSQLDAEQLAKLNCPSCANVNASRRKRNENTPVGSPVPTRPGQTAGMSGAIKEKTQPLHSSDLSLDNIGMLLDQKLAPSSAAMINLRTAWIDDVKTIITAEINNALKLVKAEFTTTTDFIMKEVTDLNEKIKNKDNLIKELEEKQSELSKDCAELRNRLTSMERMSRACNVEIQAVPESPNEDVMSVFAKLCNTINITIPEGEVRACRRVAKMDSSSKRSRNILVTFTSPRLRDLVLSAASRYNKQHMTDKLSSKHLGIERDIRRIYLSEHLSPDDKQLYHSTRIFAKEKNYKFVWVKFGRIYIRKDIDTSAIRVNNLNFLTKLV